MRKLLSACLDKVSLFLGRFAAEIKGIDLSSFPELGLSDVAPIARGRGQTIVNKAGRTLFKARLEGRAVKLYEAHSAEHAEFIRMVSSLPETGGLFPAVKMTSGPFVVADWAPGIPDQHSDIEGHLARLHKLHALSVSSLPFSGFDYWHDFVLPRFCRAVALLGFSSLVEDVTGIVNPVWSERPGFLSHPDFTRDNVVKSPEGGAVKVIDNEFLAIGHLPLLDLCNVLKALPIEERERATRYWFQLGSQVSHTELSATAAAWFARLVGTAFISGRLNDALELCHSYKQDPLGILPFKLN